MNKNEVWGLCLSIAFLAMFALTFCLSRNKKLGGKNVQQGWRRLSQLCIVVSILIIILDITQSQPQ